ncbi:MAG: DEAD/DEAH box helicase [Verrucomicrobiae bacterium]|nr:DEAD/DEAH box helicase [Verrucomicrobiae bacterium]
MIILHSAWREGRLFLWGEKGVNGEGGQPSRKPARRKDAKPPAHPRLAASGEIADAVRQAPMEFFPAAGDEAETVAWLPSAGGLPVPSSRLLGGMPESGVPAELENWRLRGLWLAPGVVMEWLGRCMDRKTLGPGMVLGDDIVFWTQALRFASSLTAREQFIPSLARVDDELVARWDAVWPGPDAGRLQELLKVMPHACRCLRCNGGAPVSSRMALEDFLRVQVDHMVRSSFSPAIAALNRRRRKEVFESIHEHWLHALRSPEGVLRDAEGDLEQLERQVREWRRPLTVATASSFRLCFRLEEPLVTGEGECAEAQGPWVVRYLLQAADDPSLIIDVKDAWHPTAARAMLLRRHDFNVREYLLSALGQAAGICPRIEESLKKAGPAGYELDDAGAYEFLTQKAWGLEQAGFGVMLPSWWTRKGTRARLSARVSVRSAAMQNTGALSLDEVVRFDWKLAVGDAELTAQELEALAHLKTPLVRIRGQWVQLSGDEIRAALEQWKKKGLTGALSVRELMRMAMGAHSAGRGAILEGVAAEGWVKEFLAQLQGDAAYEELPAPEGFCGTLRPYQIRGFSWLSFLKRWGLGACLADDMGLGKTIQLLTLIQRDWEKQNRAPVLLACPMSVVGNWQREAARFTPQLPVLAHHGMERARGADFRPLAARQAIVVTSYALLHRDFDLFKDVAWQGVVLDEAQNIKNPDTKQARAARLLKAQYRVALTGTPVENNVGDLWSIMEFLNPGWLGSRGEFKQNFFYQIQVDRDPEVFGRLKKLTGPFILRRLKTDKKIISDLPEKMEMKVFCPLTKEQASLYTAVVREATEVLEQKEGIGRRGHILATLLKLKQVCNHPAQFLGDHSAIEGRSGKLARLTEMLEEVLAEKDHALVFTQFAEMGTMLQRHLQETFGQEVFFLHGGTPKRERDEMVDCFQNAAGAPPIFLLSLKAGGTGLNLTRASHVFHFDRWWNPAVENQATDRAFRIGQTRRVQVHKFLCQGTLEEKIDAMIEAKKEVASGVVGAGEGWLTELSSEELKELFALREEAVQE